MCQSTAKHNKALSPPQITSIKGRDITLALPMGLSYAFSLCNHGGKVLQEEKIQQVEDDTTVVKIDETICAGDYFLQVFSASVTFVKAVSIG